MPCATLVSKLKPSANIVKTELKKPRIDQNEESDLAFIEKLAGRNKTVVYYIRDDKFYFGPRAQRGEARPSNWSGARDCELLPAGQFAKQVTEVVVHGRSAVKGEAIFGMARRGDEEGSDKQRRERRGTPRQGAEESVDHEGADGAAQPGRSRHARQGDPRRTCPGLRDRRRRVHRHSRDRAGHQRLAAGHRDAIQQDSTTSAKPRTSSTRAAIARRSRYRNSRA